MIEDFLRAHLWPGLTAWIVLYVSDYVLTVVCARLYRKDAGEHIVFEGSFELTPQFQADIDALRWISPKFLTALTVSTGMLALIWWQSSISGSAIYLFVLGATVLLELAVHMRHFRNVYQFRTCFGRDGIRGRLEYPREVTLRLSAFELLEFAVLFFIVSFVTGSVLFVGGAASCLAQAVKHRRWLHAWRKRGHAQDSSRAVTNRAQSDVSPAAVTPDTSRL